MVRVGTLEQIKLASVLQRIEAYRKTGLLTVEQSKQRVEIYVQDGRIACICSSQSNIPLERRLVLWGIISQNDVMLFNSCYAPGRFATRSELQTALGLIEMGLLRREQLDVWTTREAVNILRSLLGLVVGEICFEEGVQPPRDRLHLALRFTSLLSVLGGYASNASLSTKEANGVTRASLPRPQPFVSHMPRTPQGPSRPSQVQQGHQPFVSHMPGTPQGMAAPNMRTGVQPDTPTKFRRVVRRPPGSLSAAISLPVYNSTFKIPIPGRQRFALSWEALLVVAILLVGALAHGINMFHFPYFENDEGTYMSQAWSVVYQGKLAPYTYWYDHAPVGWLQIALWGLITGGFHTFGLIINSGRILMLLYQIGSSFMLYRIGRAISQSITISSIVALLFMLSPLGIYFHRRILLDNSCTFWMLLSILLLVSEQLSLKRVWLSAVALSISILSKEVTVFLFPVMVYLVFFRTDKSHRLIATGGWITIVIAIVSLYVLMAAINNELFPTGTFLGGTAPHVSLLGTLQYQTSRGKDGGLFDLHSGFWSVVGNWMQEDPMLVIVGGFCSILSVIVIKWHRMVGIMGLLSLSLWCFLGRGGEVIVFYLIPLLPLLALNIGLVLGLMVSMLSTFIRRLVGNHFVKYRVISGTMQALMVIACLLGITSGYFSSDLGLQSDHFMLWTSEQADAQVQAIVWIEAHIPTNSTIVVDDYMWIDLYDTGDVAHNYKHIQWFWKVELDPAIRNNVFHNDWRNADYIVTTDEILHQIQIGLFPFVKEIYMHSTPIVRFDTGNWPVEVRKINK